MRGREPFDEISAQYSAFAEHCDGESACFAEWSRAVLADEQVRRWVGALPGLKSQPNLVFAAARWHGVPAPGPYAGLRGALLGDDGSIRATIVARSTQTNEVGRLATLLPAFGLLASGRPIALLEAGASAGLNLFADRWGCAWSTPDAQVRVGPAPHPESVQVTCTVTGPAPLPKTLPQIAWRGGVDLNPLDVGDQDAMAWLENLVWPEQDDRRTRLRQAVAVARSDPPLLVRGDLLEELPGLVAAASAYATVIVFHTAVAAYLSVEDRGRVQELMLDLVRQGACHWVSNESPGVFPDITAALSQTSDPGAHPGHLVLAIDGRAVAWTHGHGRCLHWL